MGSYTVKVEEAKASVNGKPSAGPVYRCIYAKDGLMEIPQGMESPWDFFSDAVGILLHCLCGFSSSPFKKMSIIFANKMIGSVASEATTLHIVDFGILYGFQWPVLIQHLSERHGGPPKLRITGIELPQPGFRPADSVEETGVRLKKYCERFGVPFEYQAIATQNWCI